MNWIGQENVPFVNTPSFFIHVSGRQEQAVSARPCAEPGGKQPGSQLQSLNLACYSPVMIFKCLDVS